MKTDLKRDEKIILETQKHWMVLIGPFILTLIVPIIGFVAGSYGVLIAIIFICYFIYIIVQRNNDIWVVTNLRVIHEYGVFSNNSKESPLDKINNITYKQSLFGKMFSYGNVQIQTAAEIGSTTDNLVKNPDELKDTITHMQEEYKSQQIKMQATELAKAIAGGQQNNKTDVASELEKLHELKQKGILTEEEYKERKTKILNS